MGFLKQFISASFLLGVFSTVNCYYNNSVAELSPPTGWYTVSSKTFPMVDNNRVDIFNHSQLRCILVTLFYPSSVVPAVNTPTNPYLTPVLATVFERLGFPSGSASQIKTNSYPSLPLEAYPDGGLRTILYSPGLGSSRLFHQTVFEELASRGYLVVAIDHPYDSLLTEFPDGKVIPSRNDTGWEDIIKKNEQRIDDIIYVARTFQSGNFTVLRDLGLPSELQQNAIGVFGHSLGGSSSAGAILKSSPELLVGGINLDGGIFGSAGAPGADLKRPFVQFGNSNHSSETDVTWQAFEGNQTDWLRELSLEGSQHLTYCDLPKILDILELRDCNCTSFPSDEDWVAFAGTIDGERAVEILRAYVVDFFEWTLRGVGGKLYDGYDKMFPEIKFVFSQD